jgi:transposase
VGLGLRGIANHLADICGRCWDVSFVTNYRHSFQNDSQVVEEILNTPRAPLAVTADKAYDSVKVRQQIMDEGALPVIPSRCTATKKAYCPKRFYRRRHKIENFFCRIKDWRRIATRYDKLARNFLAATIVVRALYWIKL